MEYIYDIILNFQDEYYEYYEWNVNDKIMNVKKIPLLMVDSSDYLKLKYNKVTIDSECLNKKSKMFLVTNGMEVMGILLNNLGSVVKRSSLLIDEMDDVLDNLIKKKVIKIKYIEDIKRDVNYYGRVFKEKYNYLEKFLNGIKKDDDKYLLKYIYFDIYNKEEDDVDKIFQKLIFLRDNNLDILYDSVNEIVKLNS